MLGGLATVAFIVGFMVGGSRTPMAAVAVPLIFAFIPTAMTLAQSLRQAAVLKDIRAQTDSAQVVAAMNSAKAAGSELQMQELGFVGLCLLAFSLGYAPGAYSGIMARTHDFFAPTLEARTLPWEGQAGPPNAANAINWVATQERLLALGYNAKQVQSIYMVQIGELETQELAEVRNAQSRLDALGGAVAPDVLKETGANDQLPSPEVGVDLLKFVAKPSLLEIELPTPLSGPPNAPFARDQKLNYK